MSAVYGEACEGSSWVGMVDAKEVNTREATPCAMEPWASLAWLTEGSEMHCLRQRENGPGGPGSIRVSPCFSRKLPIVFLESLMYERQTGGRSFQAH